MNVELARMWLRAGAVALTLALAACSGGDSSSQDRPGVVDPLLALDSLPEAGTGTVHGVRSGLLGERAPVPVIRGASAVRAATPAAAVPTDGTPPTISITVRGFAFPQEVRVAAGARVAWVNADSVAHDVTAVDGSWGSLSFTGGASYVRDFAVPGRYPYLCTIHPFMQGVLVVE